MKKILDSMIIKDAEQIDKMRVSSQLAASVLEMIEKFIRPGVSTLKLDQICYEYIVNDLKATPSTLGHYGFPACICTSINHVVCHGIPSEKEILKEGDIINIDVTVSKAGYIGDTSKMYFVGEPKIWAKKLVTIAQECLYKAIEIVKPGITTGDIGYIIQKHAISNHYSIVKEFCGHGIGARMWENPEVPHYGNPGTGVVLKEGLTFTIEPMVNLDKAQIKTLPDGWTIITKDRKLSAQFEHTILVTENGYEILSIRKEEENYFKK